MFTGGLKESEMSRVKLQGVCVSSMAKIITFMYTGRIHVTEVTVCQLLPAATMFQVHNVIEACCAFLERQLDPQNGDIEQSFANKLISNETCLNLFSYWNCKFCRTARMQYTEAKGKSIYRAPFYTNLSGRRISSIIRFVVIKSISL